MRTITVTTDLLDALTRTSEEHKARAEAAEGLLEESRLQLQVHRFSAEQMQSRLAQLTREKAECSSCPDHGPHLGFRYCPECYAKAFTEGQAASALHSQQMRKKLEALIAKWRENADMLAEGNKSEHADPSVGMQRRCADELAALTGEAQPPT